MFELTQFDHFLARWFHARQSATVAEGLYALSAPGSARWIALVLVIAVAYALWRKHWYGLLWTVLVVPGGMLLGEAIKLLVQRQRPYLVGPFVDWSGYSFPSGHTIGATLLYGWLTFLLIKAIRAWHWRAVAVATAMVVIAAVGFSRIALGAHYFTDVVAAMVIGTVWLGVCTFLVEAVRRRDRQPIEVVEPEMQEAAQVA